jgi:DNA replication protein DnaC
MNDEWEKLIESAPYGEDQPRKPMPNLRDISPRTGLDARYRPEWTRPSDSAWIDCFSSILATVKSGGMIALIGNRGTGKTRISAEAIRDFSRNKSTYMTAMGLFLRIRSTYGKKSSETETEVVTEISKSPLLVIDEIQERGNSLWEDRILTYIIDKRYSSMRPTIIIGNLTPESLISCLGDSVVSRINETGGVIEMKGKSHR